MRLVASLESATACVLKVSAAGYDEQQRALHVTATQVATIRVELAKHVDVLQPLAAAPTAEHESVLERALFLAEMEGAPATAGKDGEILYDPSVRDADGKPAMVRDYSGRIAALKLALEADRERRKLLGLDAASKIESTATVRYVLEGINPEDLA